MNMKPLAIALVVEAIAGAAIAVLANTVAVPVGVSIALILLAIALPTFLALRADSHRRGLPTRF